jgi:hypothetical protein
MAMPGKQAKRLGQQCLARWKDGCTSQRLNLEALRPVNGEPSTEFADTEIVRILHRRRVRLATGKV